MKVDLEIIRHRQILFCMTLKLRFMTKITKYQNLMMKHGVHIEDQSFGDCVIGINQSPSFEDEIELVLGHNSASPRMTFLKIGNRISTVKLFQWIYKIVQRTKAACILKHLNGVPDSEVKSTVESVAQEIVVAYEYQLMVLYSDVEVVKLAQHAVACMLVYLNSRDARFTCENLLQALLEVKPNNSRNKEILRTQSVMYDGQPVCLRWRLSQVLKQPGLRVTVQQTEPDENTSENSTNGVSNGDVSIVSKDEADNVQTDGQVTDTAVCSFPKDTSLNRELDEDNFDNSKKLEISLEDVSAVLLRGQIENSEMANGDTKAAKIERRISAIEMDYENGFMHISHHSVEVDEDDFSPVDTNVSVGDGVVFSEDVDLEKSSNKDFGAEVLMKDNAGEVTVDRNYKTGLASVHNHDCAVNGDQENEMCTFSISEAVANTGQSDKEVKKIGRQVSDSLSNNLSTHQEPELESVDGAFAEKAMKNSVHNDINVCLSKTSKMTNENHTPDEVAVELRNKDGQPKGSESRKSFKFYGCFTPYGAKCQPKIYGFRGPLHVWSDKEGRYTLIYNDTVTVNCFHRKELSSKEEDPHQSYYPLANCRH